MLMIRPESFHTRVAFEVRRKLLPCEIRLLRLILARLGGASEIKNSYKADRCSLQTIFLAITCSLQLTYSGGKCFLSTHWGRHK